MVGRSFDRSAMSKPGSTCVLISYYDRRSVEPIWRLFECMARNAPGRDYRVGIVVNRTGAHRLSLPTSSRLIAVHERENLGMNIGAWDAGWRHFAGFETYAFLQDECYPVRAGWLDAIAACAERADVGLAGESMNTSWELDWNELRENQAAHPMPEHLIDGKAANRVDAYLDFFRRAGIPPGATGRHLRSLTWAARRDVLERIGGFPIGANYGECIAAEIGTTKRIEAGGLRAVQVAEQPFAYVRHMEWNQDGPGGPFVHSAPPAALFERPNWADGISAGVLPWRDVLRLLIDRLRRPLARTGN